MPGPKGAKVRNVHFQHFDISLSVYCWFENMYDSFLFVFFRAALAEWVEEDLGATEVIRCGSLDMMNLESNDAI